MQENEVNRTFDNVEYLLNLSRKSLIDLIQRASYVEMFQKASQQVLIEIKQQKINDFKNTSDFKEMESKREAEIQALDYEKEAKKIKRRKLWVKILKHKKKLYALYILLAFFTVMPITLIFSIALVLLTPSSIGSPDNKMRMGGIMALVLIVFGFLYLKFKIDRNAEARKKLNDLEIKHNNAIPSINQKYEKLSTQTALKVVQPRENLVNKYYELRNMGITSESYRLIFPKAYQNLASLKLLHEFLEDGIATSWQEAMTLYRNEENIKRLERVQFQVGKMIEQSIDKNSIQIKNAIQDLQSSTEAGFDSVLDKINDMYDVQVEQMYIQDGIYNEARFANDRPGAW